MPRTYDLTEPPGSPAPAAPTGTTTLPGASNRQLDFLASLIAEREISPEARDQLNFKIIVQRGINAKHGDCAPPLAANGLTKRRASEFISRLLEQPHRKDRPTERTTDLPPASVLPAGRYAIENDDGELRFYRVWRGDRNLNYVKLYVEHGPDDSEIPFKSAKAIFGKIVYGEGGPEAAARRYGREIGACSQCGRRLTNRVSRLLSIGPICGGRFRDDFGDEVVTARDALRAAGLDPKGDVEDTDDLDRIRDAAGL